jgi:hypothetical protein
VYWDKFDNHCGRLSAPAGDIRFLNELDAYAPEAAQHDVQELPVETLLFLCRARKGSPFLPIIKGVMQDNR